MAYRHHSWTWTAPDLNPTEKLVLICICDHIPEVANNLNEVDVAWPSIRRIAGMVNLTDRQVTRVISSLVKKSYIERIDQYSNSGDRTVNKYKVKIQQETSENISYATQWPQALRLLREKFGTEKWQRWFSAMTPITTKDGVLKIGVPTIYHYEYINEPEKKDALLAACKESGMRVRSVQIHTVLAYSKPKSKEPTQPPKTDPPLKPDDPMSSPKNEKSDDDQLKRVAERLRKARGAK